MALTSGCVILVPVGGTLDPGCEDGLRELERRGYPVRRVRGFSQEAFQPLPSSFPRMQPSRQRRRAGAVLAKHGDSWQSCHAGDPEGRPFLSRSKIVLPPWTVSPTLTSAS